MRFSSEVVVGNIGIGGLNPTRVQSMTDTDTADYISTVKQIIDLANAGSEIVRITVNNAKSAGVVHKIKGSLLDKGFNIPIVGDFHYNGHKLLSDFPQCANALDKYRINPGNVGFGDKRDDQFQSIINLAIEYDKPIRIGVNWGSLDQSVLTELMNLNAQSDHPKSSIEIQREAVIISAITSAQKAIDYGLSKDKIILSCKMSNVQDLIAVYQSLSKRVSFPLHLGLTEAGMGIKGIVSSTAALSVLLQQGIGDTIRISLTPEPGSKREKEVTVAQQILQSMEIRKFVPQVISCPGCGRTTSSYFRELAEKINDFIMERLPYWKKHFIGVENIEIAVMGCIVNGPGESKHANIGISLPGSGESPKAPVFINGKKVYTLQGNNIANEFKSILDSYIEQSCEKII